MALSRLCGGVRAEAERTKDTGLTDKELRTLKEAADLHSILAARYEGAGRRSKNCSMPPSRWKLRYVKPQKANSINSRRSLTRWRLSRLRLNTRSAYESKQESKLNRAENQMGNVIKSASAQEALDAQLARYERIITATTAIRDSEKMS